MKLDTAMLLEFPTKIVGEHVVLVSYQNGDGQALWDLTERNREMLTRWMYWAPAMTEHLHFEKFARDCQASWIARKEFCFGVLSRSQFDANDRQFIGGASIFNANWAVPSFELGYFLDAEQHGNGLVTEAVQLLIQFAFKYLQANRVFASCDVNNLKSEAVMIRADMLKEAHLKNERLTPAGAIRDTLIYAVTSSVKDIAIPI